MKEIEVPNELLTKVVAKLREWDRLLEEIHGEDTAALLSERDRLSALIADWEQMSRDAGI